jgi:alkylation response protein AidB-like acyl-CoA dehydrogenase
MPAAFFCFRVNCPRLGRTRARAKRAARLSDRDMTGDPASTATAHRAMLQTSVADFVARGTDLARVRRLRGTSAEYDRAVWKKMAQLGWLGILVPEHYGGLGLGLAEMAIVARGLARALVPEPLTATAVLAATALVAAENEALKREQLPRLAAGDLVAVLAWQERAGGLDPAAIETRATPFEGGFKLNGEKRFVAGAAQADAFIVSARTADDIVLLWVPRAAAGALDDGWTVAKALLGFERLAIGSPRRPQYALNCLEAVARAKGLLDDPGFVDRFTALKLDIEDGAALYGRFVEQVKRGEPLGQDVSMLKVWTMETWQRLTDLLLEAGAEQGIVAGVHDVAGVEADFLNPFYYARPATIYGGSSEIQRNILAKTVLKLPD